MRARVWTLCLMVGVAVGCRKQLPVAAPVDSAAEVVELARERPTPARIRSRFNIKLRSKTLDLAGSTGGALIVDRPGQGHVAILGPLGSPLVKAQADGVGLAVSVTKDKRHLVALDAESVLAQTTGGAAGLDDLLALLIGDLPFEDAKVKSRKVLDEGVEFRLAGPNDVEVTTLLDPVTGTPHRIEAQDKDGMTLVSATYAAFEALPEDGPLMPTQTVLQVPAMDLTVTLTFKGWKPMDEPAPSSVFDLQPPPGFEVDSLESVLRGSVERVTKELNAAESPQ